MLFSGVICFISSYMTHKWMCVIVTRDRLTIYVKTRCILLEVGYKKT